MSDVTTQARETVAELRIYAADLRAPNPAISDETRQALRDAADDHDRWANLIEAQADRICELESAENEAETAGWGPEGLG